MARRQNFDEAANNLAAVLNDRDATRKTRWQAVQAISEICGDNKHAWHQFKNKMNDWRINDAEIESALAAFELLNTNRAAEAQILLENSQSPTANLRFLAGLAAAANQQTDRALNHFVQAFKIDKNAELAFALKSTDNEALQQIIRAYLAHRQPRAALRLAAAETDLNDEKLLGLLSNAAEQTGDWQRAIEFETLRQSLLAGADEQAAANRRIEFLRNRKLAAEPAAPTFFRVSGQTIAE